MALITTLPARSLDETLPEVFENDERLDSFDLDAAQFLARRAMLVDPTVNDVLAAAFVRDDV